MRNNGGLGSWENRRKFMWCNTLFNMSVVIYCLISNLDSALARLAVEACFWSNTGTLLMYVFGATVQDIFALRTGGLKGGIIGNVTQTTESVQTVRTASVGPTAGIRDPADK